MHYVIIIIVVVIVCVCVWFHNEQQPVRDGVLEHWPQPPGQLEDKLAWPWP